MRLLQSVAYNKMKLIKLDQTTLPKQMGGGSKTARVSFGKAGTITFNYPACTLIGIKNEDKVTLAQDEGSATDWYFFKDEVNGFKLRNGYDKKGCLFNHAKMVQELVSAFGLDESITHNFLLAGQPTIIKGDKTQYWCLLVKPA